MDLLPATGSGLIERRADGTGTAIAMPARPELRGALVDSHVELVIVHETSA